MPNNPHRRGPVGGTAAAQEAIERIGLANDAPSMGYDDPWDPRDTIVASVAATMGFTSDEIEAEMYEIEHYEDNLERGIGSLGGPCGGPSDEPTAEDLTTPPG